MARRVGFLDNGQQDYTDGEDPFAQFDMSAFPQIDEAPQPQYQPQPDYQPQAQPQAQAPAMPEQPMIARPPADISLMPIPPVSRPNIPAPTSMLPAPPGFDGSKWNDPNNASIKYKAGHILASGGSIYDAAAAIGGQVTGKDTIFIPGDGEYDVFFDVGGLGQHPQWEPTGVSVGLQTYNPNARNWGNPAPAAGGSGGGASGAGGGSTAGLDAFMQSVLDQLAHMPQPSFESGGYAPPGSVQGMDNSNVIQIGQDPLSREITSLLMGMAQNSGQTPFGQDLEATLRGLIAGGGNLNQDRLNQRLIGARDTNAMAFRGQLADTRGALADRGLLSEPGIPQGSEALGVRRIAESLAPTYANSVRDIYVDESRASDARLSQALSLATGMASEQASNLLATVNSSTARQQMLSQIALQTLGQNIEWNKFLAQYGLDRDKLLNDIQSGRTAQVIQMLQMFLTAASLSRGGYVGN